MTAATIALFDHDERSGLLRWLAAGVVVLAVHVGMVMVYRLTDWSRPVPQPQEAAIMVELAPVAVAPASPNDVAPGPEMLQSLDTPPPPPPPPEPLPELYEPLPKLDTPAVVTLPPSELKPEPPKPIEKPPEQKVEEKPVEKPPEKKVEPKPREIVREKKPPAPRTTAAPRSDQQTARVAQAPSPGRVASAGPSPSWISQLMAHINRHKQYPSAAQAQRSQGTAVVAFTMSRSGQVLSRRIVRSSGVSALDSEALAMLGRAQPLPAFPSTMSQSSQSFTVPVNFSLR